MITRKNLSELIDYLKSEIADDYRSTIQEIGDENPMMDVTIGCDNELEYSWQTGDNSYTGGAYGYPHWAVVYLSPDDDTNRIVDSIIEQLEELLPEYVDIPVE